MNDDIERRLRQVTPRGAPPELRPRVLAAVAGSCTRPLRTSAGRSAPHSLSPRLCSPAWRLTTG